MMELLVARLQPQSSRLHGRIRLRTQGAHLCRRKCWDVRGCVHGHVCVYACASMCAHTCVLLNRGSYLRHMESGLGNSGRGSSSGGSSSSKTGVRILGAGSKRK